MLVTRARTERGVREVGWFYGRVFMILFGHREIGKSDLKKKKCALMRSAG
jgi:hypothetical protein